MFGSVAFSGNITIVSSTLGVESSVDELKESCVEIIKKAFHA